MEPPRDIVDRAKPKPSVHGTTWQTHVDAFLDEISRRDRDRQDALDAIHRFISRHPDADQDDDLTTARLSLLR